MKLRFFKNLLCLFTAVALAAAAQEVVPALWSGVRTPWLVGVASYYAVRRGAGWGFAASLWCGALQDGLDGADWTFNAPLFVGFWALCVFVVKKQMPDGALTCAAVAVVFALAREFACFSALASSDNFAAAATAGRLLARLMVTAPAAALAAGLTAVLAARADSALGNMGEERVDEAF